MDSNQTVPYFGKGKGRATDVGDQQQNPDTAQDVVPQQQQPSIASFEPFHVPGIGFDGIPPPDPEAPQFNPNNFDFVQEQMLSWQPIHPDYLQDGIMDPASQEFQISQANAHPHAHPPPVQQQVQIVPPPMYPPQQQMWTQMPLWHAYQPPPGLPQQDQPIFPIIQSVQPPAQAPDFPSQQPPPQQIQPAQPPPTTEAPTDPATQPSGYRFHPGLGFVCLVCGFSMRQPGVHPFQGSQQSSSANRWCWADGPVMQMDAKEEAERRDRRGKKKPRVRLSYI
ncbi:hypothetical protein Q7P37_001509 [Cladosporium fusiforme]